MDVKVPHEAKMTPNAMKEFATEVAFNALVAEAKKLGLNLAPVAGLMYLPSQQVTEQFKEVCVAVLDSISV